MGQADTATRSAPTLVLDGVRRTFGAVTAVDGLSLTVEPGQVVGLLGHNGAGKTTTVRLLAGLLAPDQGTVAVEGLDPVDQGSEVRRRLGVLPARTVVDDRLTGVANLRFVAETHGLPREGLDDRIAAALAAFDLTDRGDERAGGYSTGMRQRLALARVLLPEPRILLLDEPTAALDPIAARQVRRTLAELARQRARTVVLCTHDLAEAEQLCDRVVVLQHGRVVAQGSPAEMAAAHGTGGVLLEVAEQDIAGASAVLDEVAPGATVEREGGGRLRIQGLARAAVPGLVGHLVARRVSVYEVARLDPTLADVYLALHQSGAAGAAGPADDLADAQTGGQL